MEMTDAEIVQRYKANSNQKQIRILADLNDCENEDVRKILIASGLDVPEIMSDCRIKSRKGRMWKPDTDVFEHQEEFIKTLRDLLNRDDVSQAEFSRKTGISESSISRYLTNRGMPSRKTFEKILKFAKKTRKEFLKL